MNWRRLRRILAGVGTIVLFVFVAVSWTIGTSLIAPANRTVGPPPVGWPIESTTITCESGASIAAWFMPRHESTATVILLHPIRSDRRAMLSRAKLLYDAGYSTLLIDLQGHGESPGKHVTAGFRERHGVSAAVEFVRQRTPDHRIAIVGRSLGGAASLLASPLEIDALVLESVYPTITDAVRDRIEMRLGAFHYVLTPALLLQLQIRLGVSPSELRPIDRIAEIGCPVLVAAGDADMHTPLSETIRLHEAAREPKQLMLFSGAAHVDLLQFDEAKYRAEVLSFLAANLR